MKSLSNLQVFLTQAFSWHKACLCISAACMCKGLCRLPLLFSLKRSNPPVDESTISYITKLLW